MELQIVYKKLTKESKIACMIPAIVLKTVIKTKHMKTLTTFISCLFIMSAPFFSSAQSNVYVLDTERHTMYVNNQPGNYFSIEFDKGDLEKTDADNVYTLFGRHSQILSIPYDSKSYFLVGNPAMEKQLLYDFMKQETDYLKKSFGRSLELKKEMIQNKTEKNFLIWSYRAKYKSKYDDQELKEILKHSGSGDVNFDNITHQVNLTFVSNKHIISIINPIFTGEVLEDEIEKLEYLTEQITTCAFPIDVQLLLHKTYAAENNSEYELKDEAAGITIPLPEWLNFCHYPAKNSIMAGFKEQNGITDLVLVNWESRRSKKSFATFIEESLADTSITTKNLCNDNPIDEGIFYDVVQGDYFKCKYVFLEGKDAYCKLVFLASPDTYSANLPWMNDFISNIEIERTDFFSDESLSKTTD